jgi:hypothetical protein
VDACTDAAPALAAAYEPGAALAMWLHRYTELVATKRGLAAALQRLESTLGSLIDAATASGEIRTDVSPRYLIDGLRYGANTTQTRS